MIVPTLLADPPIADGARVSLLRRLYEVEYSGPRPFRRFSGPGLDGKVVSTDRYRGEVLLVVYWATW